MTTFQYLIDAFFNALSLFLPISMTALEEANHTLLHWNASPAELRYLVSFIGLLCLLAFFRFDWLGLFSAIAKSLIKPKSLQPLSRSLDQHTLIFLFIVCLPRIIFEPFLSPFFKEGELLSHPFFMAAGFLFVSITLHFATLRNKRIKGLNHLKVLDSFFISAISVLSIHPSIPLPFALWAGFALMNYHYETIFKYSMLIITIHLGVEFISLSHLLGGIKSIPESLGHLNTFAVSVILFTTFWMTLEQLQKSLNESTFNRFKWFNLFCMLFFIAIYFYKANI